MTSEVRDLLAYDELRRESSALMVVVTVRRPIIVLGSRQGLDLLAPGVDPTSVRRRRGGGGAVLAQPGDLWVDWWIPPSDPRWDADVRRSAVAAGQWWRAALAPLTPGDVVVYDGPLEGAAAHQVACFAGRGPGEVFVDGRKAVGLTQWRVREGILLSSVLPAADSAELVGLLADPPDGLAAALTHATTRSLGLDDRDEVIGRLADASGRWTRRDRHLD